MDLGHDVGSTFQWWVSNTYNEAQIGWLWPTGPNIYFQETLHQDNQTREDQGWLGSRSSFISEIKLIPLMFQFFVMLWFISYFNF